MLRGLGSTLFGFKVLKFVMLWGIYGCFSCLSGEGKSLLSVLEEYLPINCVE